MAVNNQFSIAVHLLASLGACSEKNKTSAELAMSINTSPSFIRRTLAKLSKANLVNNTTGKSGSCKLAREPSRISLLDIYQAIEAPQAFAIHNYPVQKACTISCSIKSSMEKVLDKTQKSMEDTLKKVTLAEVIADIRKK